MTFAGCYPKGESPKVFCAAPACVPLNHGTHRLAAAGIYTPRKDDAGEWYLTVSIITREARDASGEVHDRMPVFLEPGVFDRWLSPAKIDCEHWAHLTSRSFIDPPE